MGGGVAVGMGVGVAVAVWVGVGVAVAVWVGVGVGVCVAVVVGVGVAVAVWVGVGVGVSVGRAIAVEVRAAATIVRMSGVGWEIATGAGDVERSRFPHPKMPTTIRARRLGTHERHGETLAMLSTISSWCPSPSVLTICQ